MSSAVITFRLQIPHLVLWSGRNAFIREVQSLISLSTFFLTFFDADNSHLKWWACCLKDVGKTFKLITVSFRPTIARHLHFMRQKKTWERFELRLNLKNRISRVTGEPHQLYLPRKLNYDSYILSRRSRWGLDPNFISSSRISFSCFLECSVPPFQHYWSRKQCCIPCKVSSYFYFDHTYWSFWNLWFMWPILWKFAGLISYPFQRLFGSFSKN